ncbi:acireductone dioxygenase [Salinisphaera sp. T31B1]
MRLCDADPHCIAARLAAIGVHYRSVALPAVAFDAEAGCDEIVGSYLAPLNTLLDGMDGVSLDVTTVMPDHPRIASLQRTFMTEHRHDAVEAQIMVWGRGTLYMRGRNAVWALCCGAGDFVRLPAGMGHWFAFDTSLGFRTLRLFESSRGQRRIRRGRNMSGVYAVPRSMPQLRPG